MSCPAPAAAIPVAQTLTETWPEILGAAGQRCDTTPADTGCPATSCMHMPPAGLSRTVPRRTVPRVWIAGVGQAIMHACMMNGAVSMCMQLIQHTTNKSLKRLSDAMRVSLCSRTRDMCLGKGGWASQHHRTFKRATCMRLGHMHSRIACTYSHA